MHLIGKSKKATSDAFSMASVSLSRKSSFSSNVSGLAFSSPSPIQMGMILGVENQPNIQLTNSLLSIPEPIQKEMSFNHIEKLAQQSSIKIMVSGENLKKSFN